ncbi:MAG: hypothetical protein QXJ06_03890 [Candidatus Aenigmatarchaeota archaeon]
MNSNICNLMCFNFGFETTHKELNVLVSKKVKQAVDVVVVVVKI